MIGAFERVRLVAGRKMMIRAEVLLLYLVVVCECLCDVLLVRDVVTEAEIDILRRALWEQVVVLCSLKLQTLI